MGDECRKAFMKALYVIWPKVTPAAEPTFPICWTNFFIIFKKKKFPGVLNENLNSGKNSGRRWKPKKSPRHRTRFRAGPRPTNVNSENFGAKLFFRQKILQGAIFFSMRFRFVMLQSKIQILFNLICIRDVDRIDDDDGDDNDDDDDNGSDDNGGWLLPGKSFRDFMWWKATLVAWKKYRLKK